MSCKGVPACPKSSYLFCNILLQTIDLIFVLRNSDLNPLPCPSCFLCPVQQPTSVSSLLEPNPCSSQVASATPLSRWVAWEVGKAEQKLLSAAIFVRYNHVQLLSCPCTKRRKINQNSSHYPEWSGKRGGKEPNRSVQRERQNIIFVNNGATEVTYHIVTWD